MTQIPYISDTFDVVCRLGVIAPDDMDDDTAPDVKTVGGVVHITILVDNKPVKALVYEEDDGHFRLIQVRGITYSIDRYTGSLLSPDGRKLSLYKASSPRVQPNNFTYLANVVFDTGLSLTIPFDETPTHPDGTVDLGALTGLVRY